MYDLIIIGAGPAGLNASVYASRYGLKNLVIGEISGGLTTQTHEIGNWLGEEKISGFEFAQKAANHVKSLGAEIKATLVDQVKKNENGTFEFLLADGDTVQSKTILIATGSKHRKLGVPGEKELLGKGVSYCATCDGFFYKEKIVGIIGGSDSAVSAAVYMADIAKKVYLIYRKDKLRAETFWIKSVEESKSIEVVYNTNVKEIHGENKIEKVSLDNSYKSKSDLKLDGLFIEIGFTPSTALVEDLGVEIDEEGYIKVETDGKTTVSGIWAAGDITNGSEKFKQIVTAASEGAIAANSIQMYLKR
jgi:thioredoxin reductase (NADPH)